MRNTIFSRRAMALLGAAGLAAACGCATNPVTGKTNFNLISEQEEIDLGRKSKDDAIQQMGGLYDNANAQSLVAEIGKKLAAASARPDLPWSYEIVNSDEVNAFALPGGPVFITRGLLGMLRNEAELANVLGHETGHIAARHQAQEISKSVALQTAIGVGSAAAGGSTAGQVAATGATIAGQLLLLKYSRDMEAQADEIGMDYAAKIGYDPRGMGQMLEQLLAMEKARGGGGGGPTFLQTHPATADRVKDTENYVAKHFTETQLARLTQNTPRFDTVLAEVRRSIERSPSQPVPAGAPKQGGSTGQEPAPQQATPQGQAAPRHP
jgi:predicted Zn-dependent protease